MSAWVVSKHHIDLLVSAAIERTLPICLPNVGETVRATQNIADLIGSMLWRENVRSVVHRYSLSGTEEEAGYLRDLAAYRFHHYPRLRPSAIRAAAACYDYQSCECEDYRQTAAAQFVAKLEEAVGERTDDDGGEPWGFDTAESVADAVISDAI